MERQQKDNSGVIFRNDRKSTDRHPDYNGQVMVAGKGYWISMWVKQSRAGKPFFSVALNPKEQHGQENQTIAEDGLPF